MSAEPHDWNIILLGYWNRAILTPAGIARRLFKLSPGESTYQIEVPIDGLAPPKVSYHGMAVLVASDSLEIKLEQPDYECLTKGLAVAALALEDLKETPVHAAGFNLRYRVMNPDAEIAQVTQTPLDALGDLGFEVTAWNLSRSIKFNDGQINLACQIPADGNFELVLNFHMDSSKPENHEALVNWLRMDVAEIKETSNNMLKALLA